MREIDRESEEISFVNVDVVVVFVREKHIILHHIVINLAILIYSLISRKITRVDKIITYKFNSLFIFIHTRLRGR